MPKSGTQNGGGYPERRNGTGSHLYRGTGVVQQQSNKRRHTRQRGYRYGFGSIGNICWGDPAVNAARLRAMRVAAATVGQQEAHERRTKVKETAGQCKRGR